MQKQVPKKKIKNTTSIGSTNPPSRYIAEGNENMISKILTHKFIAALVTVTEIWK